MTIPPGRSRLFRRRRIAAAAVGTTLFLVVVQALFPGTFDLSSGPVGAVLGNGHGTSRPFAGRLLVYGRHGLTAAQVASLRAAASGPVTAVYGGEVAVASGRTDYPEVPVQTFTVDAASYATAASTPGLAGELSKGAVLSSVGATLRKTRVGDHLQLMNGRKLLVSAVVDDHLLGGYEMATTDAVLGGPAGPAASYLLVATGSDAGATTRRLRAALPGIGLRIEDHTRNGFFSSADTILTQAQKKTRFGEFALRTDSSGSLRLDRAWRDSWVRSTSVPQLGVITCNKAVISELRSAMEEVTRRGLGSLVHTADFKREGGCWSPRVVRFGAGQLSAHTWGVAVDINVDANPLGAAPVQDPRLVDIMSRHGFTWGGLWLRPDGAHFEWRGQGFT